VDRGRGARRLARRDSVGRVAAAGSAARDSLRRADSLAALAPLPRRRRSVPNPSSRCGVVNFNENPATARLQSLSDGQGRYVSYVGGGAVARCEGVNSRLRADSAEYYQSAGFLVLVGNVAYDEPGRANLTSDRLTYYTGEERVVAEGNVVVRLPSGTTMRGPTAEYLRAVPPIRTTSRLTATARPTVRVVGAGTERRRARGGEPDTSITTIIANTVVDEDETIVYASGSVNIVRADVTADADSATFDQLSESARLIRNARIRGTRGRPFTLTGGVVDLFTRERDLSRVKAQGRRTW
jgi:lipopolysaccharide assembly outer membrane protein LptD (OstA)